MAICLTALLGSRWATKESDLLRFRRVAGERLLEPVHGRHSVGLISDGPAVEPRSGTRFSGLLRCKMLMLHFRATVAKTIILTPGRGGRLNTTGPHKDRLGSLPRYSPFQLEFGESKGSWL
jgi:hypothetical protein